MPETIELKVEQKEPTTPALSVVTTTSEVTVSAFSWSAVAQSVKSVGAVITPGDAGELAVNLYGNALEKLADS